MLYYDHILLCHRISCQTRMYTSTCIYECSHASTHAHTPTPTHLYSNSNRNSNSSKSNSNININNNINITITNNTNNINSNKLAAWAICSDIIIWYNVVVSENISWYQVRPDQCIQHQFISYHTISFKKSLIELYNIRFARIR